VPFASLHQAIENADSKAAGIFPADLARVLYSVTKSKWQLIQWITAPGWEQFQSDLHALAKSLLID
jgi:hypothetical protein